MVVGRGPGSVDDIYDYSRSDHGRRTGEGTFRPRRPDPVRQGHGSPTTGAKNLWPETIPNCVGGHERGGGSKETSGSGGTSLSRGPWGPSPPHLKGTLFPLPTFSLSTVLRICDLTGLRDGVGAVCVYLSGGASATVEAPRLRTGRTLPLFWGPMSVRDTCALGERGVSPGQFLRPGRVGTDVPS